MRSGPRVKERVALLLRGGREGVGGHGIAGDLGERDQRR